MTDEEINELTALMCRIRACASGGFEDATFSLADITALCNGLEKVLRYYGPRDDGRCPICGRYRPGP